MIPLLLVAGALAQDVDCTDGREGWLAELAAEGSPRAYGCLATDPGAVPLLIAAASSAEQPARYTRALALWRLHRIDEAVGAEEARTYGASDRRLLLDGIKAHRGRATPSPDHATILATLPWYAPDDGYTDARLTATDHQNLAVVMRPPAEVVPPAVPSPAPAPGRSRCGCGPSSPSGALLAALALLFSLGSTRRRPCPAASGSPRRAARPPGG